MTPKEKAQELVNKYVALTDNWVYGIHNWKHKIQCALIAVNEIIMTNIDDWSHYEFWQEVKTELEKL